MRLYLDDDMVAALLVRELKKAGHDVRVPSDVGLAGVDDPAHLTRAITEDRVFVSRNYGDFSDLHNLIMAAQARHPGILIVRRDDATRRNMARHDIVRALRKLEATGAPVADQYIFLNAWR